MADLNPLGSTEYEPFLAHWNPIVVPPASASAFLAQRGLLGFALPLRHAEASTSAPALPLRQPEWAASLLLASALPSMDLPL